MKGCNFQYISYQKDNRPCLSFIETIHATHYFDAFNEIFCFSFPLQVVTSPSASYILLEKNSEFCESMFKLGGHRIVN